MNFTKKLLISLGSFFFIFDNLFTLCEKIICYFNIGTKRKKFKFFSFSSFYYTSTKFENPEYIEIYENCNIGRFTNLRAINNIMNPSLIIEDNVNIGDVCHISCASKIVISSGTLIGQFVTINDNSHGDNNFDMLNEIKPINRSIFSKGGILIEENVWIGDKVTILGGVRIGKNSVIGANTIVINDVPEFSIYVGQKGGLKKCLK